MQERVYFRDNSIILAEQNAWLNNLAVIEYPKFGYYVNYFLKLPVFIQ